MASPRPYRTDYSPSGHTSRAASAQGAVLAAIRRILAGDVSAGDIYYGKTCIASVSWSELWGLLIRIRKPRFFDSAEQIKSIATFQPGVH